MIIRNEQDAIRYLKDHTSPDQFEKLNQYRGLLIEYNQHTNLISRHTENQIFQRHILDSFQLLQHILVEEEILDIGTGAGFPGIILSIMGRNVQMVDSNNKKVKFVNSVITELGLNSKVYHSRIENLNISTDIITCRALQPLKNIFDLINNNIKYKKLILLKGKTADDEIKEAKKYYQFNINKYFSITDNNSYILDIKEKNINK